MPWRSMTVMLFLCCAMIWASDAQAAKYFHVCDFGAFPDGKSDAGPGIRKAIEAAQHCGEAAEVVFASGQYRVTSLQDSRFCFVIQGATNLTLRGVPQKTEIVIADPKFLAMAVYGCADVWLENLAFDYDPVPFTQGTIVAVDAAGGSFDLEIESGYSLLTEPWFAGVSPTSPKLGHIMDAKERRLKAAASDHMLITGWSEVSGRIVRMTAQDNYKGQIPRLAPGDRFVLVARSCSGTFEFNGNKSGGMKNVTLYAGAGLAIAVLGNEGPLEFRNCSICFKPGTTRLITTNGDGFHCGANRKGPIVEDGFFEGMPDDTMNVYTTPATVMEKRSDTELLLSSNSVIRPGDLLQIFDITQGVRGEAKAARVESQPDGVLVVLDSPVAGVMSKKERENADTIYNLSGCGEGFVFRNNMVGAHRRHGILVRAPNGLVEGNTFEYIGGSGVAVCNEPTWPEGPVPRDLTIRGNRFVNCATSDGYAGVAIHVIALKGDNSYALGRPVAGIKIEDNTFIASCGPAIRLAAAKDAIIRNNRIDSAANVYRNPGAVIELHDTVGTIIENNQVNDPRPQTTAVVEVSPNVAAGDEGLRVIGLDAKLAPQSVPILDRRVKPEPQAQSQPEAKPEPEPQS